MPGGMTSDPQDLSRCPLGARCEYCGSDCGVMQVRAVVADVGAFCLTVCVQCAGSGLAPVITMSTAARLVAQHIAHNLDRICRD